VRPGPYRDWQRYATVLDLYLAGNSINTIGEIFGVSRQRAYQMLVMAQQQLAYRVFKGVSRPLPHNKESQPLAAPSPID
jgi:hypothetical protein